MSRRQVIVDGSNLATEGRSLPSLEQLDQAVREFIAENPDDQVTVVVDASFGHRIDPLELPIFEEAEAAGEVVSPPAGAIGRGDAFLLRIAQKTGATVLSNDSFQEFHAEHAWLFDKGRLVGGKPVPGVGWIFMDRTPVRGPKSREVVKEARRRKEAPSGDTRIDEQGALGEGGGQAPARSVDQRAKASSAVKGRLRSVDRAIETAKAEVVEPSSRPSLRRRALPPSDPVNEPLAFITFIASHPLGSVVEGLVFEYSSHGAFVEADGARCYVPLSAMGDPAPRRAREVMAKGETLPFVVQALDPQRRGIELALPGNERLAGSPTPISTGGTSLRRRASLTTSRLFGPRTGVRSMKIHPTPGTGLPPTNRPLSKSQACSAWNSWKESFDRTVAPVFWAIRSRKASPRPIAPAGGDTTSPAASASSKIGSSRGSMR